MKTAKCLTIPESDKLTIFTEGMYCNLSIDKEQSSYNDLLDALRFHFNLPW